MHKKEKFLSFLRDSVIIVVSFALVSGHYLHKKQATREFFFEFMLDIKCLTQLYPGSRSFFLPVQD